MALHRVRVFRLAPAASPDALPREEAPFTVDAPSPDLARRQVTTRLAAYGERVRSLTHLAAGGFSVVVLPKEIS